MNLKIPGAFFPLCCAFLSTRARTRVNVFSSLKKYSKNISGSVNTGDGDVYQSCIQLFHFIIFIKHKEQRKLQSQEQLQSIPIAGMGEKTKKKDKKERLYHFINIPGNFMSGIKDRIGRHEHRFGQLIFEIRELHR